MSIVNSGSGISFYQRGWQYAELDIERHFADAEPTWEIVVEILIKAEPSHRNFASFSKGYLDCLLEIGLIDNHVRACTWESLVIHFGWRSKFSIKDRDEWVRTRVRGLLKVEQDLLVLWDGFWPSFDDVWDRLSELGPCESCFAQYCRGYLRGALIARMITLAQGMIIHRHFADVARWDERELPLWVYSDI